MGFIPLPHKIALVKAFTQVAFDRHFEEAEGQNPKVARASDLFYQNVGLLKWFLISVHIHITLNTSQPIPPTAFELMKSIENTIITVELVSLQCSQMLLGFKQFAEKKKRFTSYKHATVTVDI